jgi:CheY-like chemotaxis protein
MSAAARRILVVEDDPDMLETFVEVLEMAGYAVMAAVHGEDALEKLATEPRPSLILLDLMMPVMTGWELHERMGADPALAAIPVIFVSAAGDPPEAGPARSTAYLRKPVQLPTLLETIQRLCV